jgi:hypothetical protein
MTPEEGPTLLGFLESLKSEKKPLPVSTLKALDKVYNLDASTNGEIRLRWYGLALPAGTEYAGQWLLFRLEALEEDDCAAKRVAA